MSKIQLVQSPVRFDSEAHRYYLGEQELFGITGTLIKRAFPDKYKGIPEHILANAAAKGTDIHQQIELYDAFGGEPTSIRIRHYQKLKEERGLVTLANEYLVSDEQRYASSIDIVMANHDNEIILVDTKTTYNLDKNSTALQLSYYKRWFEKLNPELQVSQIMVLWLPNKDESIAELIELNVIDDEILDAIIKADIEDKPYEYRPIPEDYYELQRQYDYWLVKKEHAEQNIDMIKREIFALMEDKQLKQIKTPQYTISYIEGKTSKRFDSAAFKKENLELYNQYQKESTTEPTLRILKK